MSIENGNRVRHSQIFAVPVEALFQSCLRGDLLRLCAGERLRKSGDFRAGERYDCEIKQGTDFIRGEFKKIAVNEELVFTWETMAGEVSSGITTITLRISPEGTGSVLHFLQENIASLEAAEDQDEGWAYNLKKLAESLG